ncbi:uncharacterized protein Dmoj_GI25637 [Drosophila mojavensis]|uniref:Uncharacterized protein n=1 Tax=Drosophila mojavensis TaxID=7230 RepID=A0A0Q9WZR8_DROMO|nr:uncharacterized protein Dmoj_GI25637 [Drosophila mojavensis]
MANRLQAYFIIAILLLSHFSNNQGFIINLIKQKFYDALILAGRTMQAIGHAGENASEYIKKLNVTEWTAIKLVGMIGNILG